MNLDRLLKKLGAAVATGLIVLGLIAGTATAASADGGGSGEIGDVETNGSGEIASLGHGSGEIG